MCNHVSLRYWLAVLLFLAVAVPAWSEDAGKQPRPKVEVSVFNLGEMGGATSADTVIVQLSEWADASEVDASRWKTVPTWHDVPPGVPAGGWVSIVVCGFRQEVDKPQREADVFAFLFDPTDGAVTAVAHLHYGMSYNANALAWYWDVPIDRLCDDLRQAWLGARSGDKRKLLRLSVSEDRSADAGAALTTDEPQAALPRISSAKGMPQVAAMAAAAAAQAGWRPRIVDRDADLSLIVRLEYLAATLRLTDPAADRRWTTRSVPATRLTAQLLRDFCMAASDDAVEAVADVQANAVLSGVDGSLCLQRGASAVLFSGVTGDAIWTRGEGVRPAEAFTMRPQGSQPPIVYQHRPRIASLDVRTGDATVLSSTGTDRAWGFDVRAGAVVAAQADTLTFSRAGEARWTMSEASPVAAGPVFAGKHVIAGLSDGQLVARATADGAEQWRHRPATDLRGPIAVAGGIAAVWSDAAETIYAFRTDSGEPAWQFRVGDALAAPVQSMGDRLLVAGKDNTVRVLRAADGKVLAEATRPNWLIDCAALEVKGRDVVVCLDITRTIVMLDPQTLAVTRRLTVPRPLRPGIVYLPHAPLTWRGEGTADTALSTMLGAEQEEVALETDHAIVVVDRDGFAYMIDADNDRQ